MEYGYAARRLLTALAAVMLIVSLFAAGLFFSSEYTEKRCTTKTHGIVTDVTVMNGNTVSDRAANKSYYTCTVEYSVGEEQFSFEESGTENKFSRGDEVSVFYDPEKPAVHYVKGIYFDSKSQLAGVKILMSFLPETAVLFILLAAAEFSENRTGHRLQLQQ